MSNGSGQRTEVKGMGQFLNDDGNPSSMLPNEAGDGFTDL